MQESDGDCERRLLAAVILQAAKDAKGKCCGPRQAEAAREWLANDGALWAADLGIRPERVRRWAACPGELPRLKDINK